MRALSLALVVTLVSSMPVVLPGQALAQEPSAAAPSAEAAEALRLVHRANNAYRSGDYRVALALYEHAYRVERSPFVLFNMAQCHRHLGTIHRAIKLYEQYLAADPTAANRQAVERILIKLRADPRAAGPGPEAPPATTPPASTPVPVPLIPVTPPAGTSPQADAAPAGPEPLARPWYKRWYVWAAVGAVVVGAAVGGGVGASQRSSAVPEGYTDLGARGFFGR